MAIYSTLKNYGVTYLSWLYRNAADISQAIPVIEFNELSCVCVMWILFYLNSSWKQQRTISYEKHIKNEIKKKHKTLCTLMDIWCIWFFFEEIFIWTILKSVNKILENIKLDACEKWNVFLSKLTSCECVCVQCSSFVNSIERVQYSDLQSFVTDYKRLVLRDFVFTDFSSRGLLFMETMGRKYRLKC